MFVCLFHIQREVPHRPSQVGVRRSTWCSKMTVCWTIHDSNSSSSAILCTKYCICTFLITISDRRTLPWCTTKFSELTLKINANFDNKDIIRYLIVTLKHLALKDETRTLSEIKALLTREGPKRLPSVTGPDYFCLLGTQWFLLRASVHTAPVQYRSATGYQLFLQVNHAQDTWSGLEPNPFGTGPVWS